MRTPTPYPGLHQSHKGDGETVQRPAVVKKDELDSMDRLTGSLDNCWASSAADVDYSQRLVFSDDEDLADKRFASSLSLSD